MEEEKYIYIKRGLGYLEFDTPISQELNANDLGTTWEDYNNGKFVLLSAEQLAFKAAHPNASIKEVFDMELTPAPTRTLEDAKEEVLSAIEEYDQSDNVNEFIVTHDGQVVTTDWFEPAKRANYKNSVESAELVGMQNVSFYVGDMPLTLSTQNAKLMLAQIQLYADACYIVTKQHIAAVEALNTIEAVDAYDYTAGYPTKLSFAV